MQNEKRRELLRQLEALEIVNRSINRQVTKYLRWSNTENPPPLITNLLKQRYQNKLKINQLYNQLKLKRKAFELNAKTLTWFSLLIIAPIIMAWFSLLIIALIIMVYSQNGLFDYYLCLNQKAP